MAIYSAKPTPLTISLIVLNGRRSSSYLIYFWTKIKQNLFYLLNECSGELTAYWENPVMSYACSDQHQWLGSRLWANSRYCSADCPGDTSPDLAAQPNLPAGSWPLATKAPADRQCPQRIWLWPFCQNPEHTDQQHRTITGRYGDCVKGSGESTHAGVIAQSCWESERRLFPLAVTGAD